MNNLGVKAWACVGTSFLVAACASFSSYGLKPGVATADDVRRTMGEPFRICPEGDNGQSWTYPRGPAGYTTFNAHLDKDGKLRSIENVLDERGFARVVIGRSTRDDILCLFGPPYRDAYYQARHERVWDYRFLDAWQYPSRFHVMFDDAGVVTMTMALREYLGGGTPERH